MFSLTNHPVKINNYTARKELNGELRVLAGTLTCETIEHNSILDQFAPALKALLYRKPDADETPPQSEIPLEVTDGLTARRLPHVKPQVWDEDWPGYTASFSSGIKLKDEITLAKLKLSKLVFEALDGGSVRISFTLSIPAPLEWMVSGKLDRLIQETVEMSLTPPGDDEPAQAEMVA